MRPCKTNEALKYLLLEDHLGPKATLFSSKIVYTGSVGKDEETYSTFKKALKTPIIQVTPSKLRHFLNEKFQR
jgi:hypothetical protein